MRLERHTPVQLKSEYPPGGYTFDVVVTREMDSIHIVEDTPILDLISDHAIVACTLQIGKPKLSRKRRTPMKLIDPFALQEDMASSALITSPATNCNDAFKQYNDTLSSLLDQRAPLCTKTVAPRVQHGSLIRCIPTQTRTQKG